MVAAKVIAGYMIISGLFVMLKGKTFIIILKDFFKHPAIMYLAALLLVVLGLMVVIKNNIWDGTWRTWVTVFGVLMLLKGLVYIFFPRTFSDIPYGKMAGFFKLMGFVIAALGVWFWYIVS